MKNKTPYILKTIAFIFLVFVANISFGQKSLEYKSIDVSLEEITSSICASAIEAVDELSNTINGSELLHLNPNSQESVKDFFMDVQFWGTKNSEEFVDVVKEVKEWFSKPVFSTIKTAPKEKAKSEEKKPE